jgi:hypothetical protein
MCGRAIGALSAQPVQDHSAEEDRDYNSAGTGSVIVDGVGETL